MRRFCLIRSHNAVVLSPFCGRIAQNPGNYFLATLGTSNSFLSMKHWDQREKHGLWNQTKLVLKCGSATYQLCDFSVLPNLPHSCLSKIAFVIYTH